MVKYDIRTVLVYFRVHKPKFKLDYVEVSRFIHKDFGNGGLVLPPIGGDMAPMGEIRDQFGFHL